MNSIDKPLKKTTLPKRGLGRGLGALLPESAAGKEENRLRQCRLDRIEPDPGQPRKHFADDALAELTESIKEHGVLQPLIVRPGSAPGSYILVAGERRWRAAARAGLSEVPALVMPLDDNRGLQVSLIENLQREDLNPLEEAQGYQRLIDEFSLSQIDVARLLGKNRATISNTLRLLKLPSVARECLLDGRLTMGHARALLTLEDADLELALSETLTKKMSVRELEKLVRRLKRKERPEEPVASAPVETSQDAGRDEDITRRLSAAFPTPVRLRRLSGGRGRLELNFQSESELEELLSRLLTSASSEADTIE